ncbi:hypothetical protein BH10PSE19_BH10PSE19_12730 [soil metagenome]
MIYDYSLRSGALAGAEWLAVGLLSLARGKKELGTELATLTAGVLGVAEGDIGRAVGMGKTALACALAKG